MALVSLPVTLIFAGALAFINVWLGLRVGEVRRREKVSVGDGGSDSVLRRMRAHANFVEYAPFVLALVGLIEFSVGASIWLWIATAIFLIARIAHPIGMDGSMRARIVGIALTLGVMIALAIWAITIPLLSSHLAPIPIETVPNG